MEREGKCNRKKTYQQDNNNNNNNNNISNVNEKQMAERWRERNLKSVHHFSSSSSPVSFFFFFFFFFFFLFSSFFSLPFHYAERASSTLFSATTRERWQGVTAIFLGGFIIFCYRVSFSFQFLTRIRFGESSGVFLVPIEQIRLDWKWIVFCHAESFPFDFYGRILDCFFFQSTKENLISIGSTAQFWLPLFQRAHFVFFCFFFFQIPLSPRNFGKLTVCGRWHCLAHPSALFWRST